MKTVVFVCGTFNENGGKASYIGEQLYNGFNSKLADSWPRLESKSIWFVNGGALSDLELAAHYAEKANIVVWLANVPNTCPKSCVDRIKVLNPKCVLVTSKRSVEKPYTLPQVVNHALRLHSNLVLLFERPACITSGYNITLLDPLGNVFDKATSYSDRSAHTCGVRLADRAVYLSKIRRVGSTKAIGSCPDQKPSEEEFMKLVRDSAQRFSSMIPSPEPVTRFVGNAAFRCSFGFPALRGDDKTFYVSRRNVSKEVATIDDFVPIVGEAANGDLLFCGDHKPSVDAPIQAKLLQSYPKVNYLLHGHVYLDNAPFTQSVLPCGALSEAAEVWYQYPNLNTKEFAINLSGHGFLAGASTPERLRQLVSVIKPRPMPELQLHWVSAGTSSAQQDED